MPARTRVAQLFAKREGFGISGDIPTERHNPGDLRHSPHSSHDGIGSNDIGIIDTDDDGWDDLERQLQLYASRGLSIREAVYEFAPSNENNSASYLQFVCSGLGLGPDIKMSIALLIPAEVQNAN